MFKKITKVVLSGRFGLIMSGSIIGTNVINIILNPNIGYGVLLLVGLGLSVFFYNNTEDK